MRIKGEFKICGRVLANLLKVFGRLRANAAPAGDVRVEEERTGLERRETPLFIQAPGAVGRLLAVAPPRTLVHAHPVAAGTAQQHVHRQTGGLAGDVPQSVVNGRTHR